MSDRVEDFSYLWAEPAGDWVLLRSPLHDDRLIIFNKKGSVLLVEDETLKDEVCKRMLDAGCEVLDRMPPLGDATPTSG